MKRYIWIALIIIILPLNNAQGFTSAQIEQFKKLSPTQQEALAQSMGVTIPSDDSNSADSTTSTTLDVASEPLVKPIEEREASATEKEFRKRTEGNKTDTREVVLIKSGAKPVDYYEAQQNTDPYRTRPAFEIMSGLQFDNVSGLSLKAPEKIRRVFENFVDESEPLTVATKDISQFGYDLFEGVPTTFAPANDIPVPSDYIIGPGDEVQVDLFGSRQDRLLLTITRKGTLNFLDEGPVNVTGLTFSKMSSLIENIVKNKMIGVNAYVTLGRLRSIRVFVLGDVRRPGSYMVSGLSTLSHALFASGGIKKIGSLRNIELRRSGKKVAAIDLYDFLLKGDTSKDVRLLPGDVIFIPPIGSTVGVAGQVKRPAIYEIKGKTSAYDLIKMAGGMRSGAYKSHAQIDRINDKGERTLVDLVLDGSGGKTRLRDGDLLKIFPILDEEEDIVHLIGNIKRPGKRAYFKGMKVLNLIKDDNDLLPETYYQYAIIEREAETNREPEIIRFNLEKVLSGDEKSATYLKPNDKIYIFHRKHFRQLPMISIEGMVQSPGSYELKKDMKLVDLILASGGLLRDAHMGKAELYRTDNDTKELNVQYVNLANVLGNDDEENVILKDLDRLVVHSIWEHKKKDFVQIFGEVNIPGTYPLSKKGTIYDLLFAGGFLTEKAYLKEAELTRYIITNENKRETKHLIVDLDAVLAGDAAANLILHPHDRLQIRQITNWREDESIEITGEVNFPGIYAIEEGETLADLLDRAGGFRNNAFIFGARFTREMIASLQKREFSDMANRLETDLARMSSAPAGLGQEADAAKQKLAMESIGVLVERLRSQEPDGRLVVKIEVAEKLRKSEFNIRLHDGDKIHIPKRPDSVLVIGEVYNPTAFLFNRRLDSDDYIKIAGGFTEIANKGAVYVVRADGSVVPSKGFWTSGTKVGPGDVIVVPEEIQDVSSWQITKDITQIIYQLGLSAASFKAVGIFN